MSLKITFDVFSGRPNPSVVLTSQESADLLARIGPIPAHPAGAAQPAAEPSRLGYRGLLIEQVQPSSASIPPRFRIAGATLSAPSGNLKTIDPSIEQSILSNATILGRAAIAGDLATIIRAQSAAHSPASPSTTSTPTAGPLACRCAPLYEPNWWNDGASGGARQFWNNCYNYACDYRTDTFAQPGNASNAQWTHLTCANVGPAAVRDGLQGIKVTTIKCPTEGHLAVLCMWENFDYHWYRMGRDGLWTHKPGGLAVTNVDNSGHLITDPRLADRGVYVGFCGFFVVMHGHIKLK
jgi:hypothetical protein